MQRMLSIWRTDSVQCELDSDAYVLGSHYEFPKGEFTGPFLSDCESCVWLMYRMQFPEPIERHPEGPSPLLTNVNALFRAGSSAIPPPSTLINNNAFATDIGWGCMIRTGQSLLANALLSLNECRINQPTEKGIQVLRQFSDEQNAKFSIHRFVEYGTQKCGKLPGQWFGPSAVAQCISAFSDDLKCYSGGMDVYESEIKQFPALILCGLRLGIEKINPIYENGLRALLNCPQSVGVAGGRTSASLYFYGFHGSKLLYHDPHEPKHSLTSHSSDTEVWETTHSNQLRGLDWAEMDPSMLAGFLIKDREDFLRWKEHLMAVNERERCVFVLDRRPDTMSDECEKDGYVMCTANDASDEAEIIIETSKEGIEDTSSNSFAII